MEVKKFFGNLLEGVRTLAARPVFVILSLVLWVLLMLVSEAGGAIAVYFQTTFSNVLWTLFAGFIGFGLVAYFSSGMIGLTRKDNLSEFFKKGNKFWFGNLLVLIVVTLSSVAVWAIANYGVTAVGRALSIDVNVAVVLFLLVYFLGLVGFLIFLSFASFFLVLKDLNVKKSILKSFSFVKKNYFSTLSLIVIFFVLYWAVGFVEGWIGDIVAFGLLFPYLIIVFSRFVK